MLRSVVVLLTTLIALTGLAACGGGSSDTSSSSSSSSSVATKKIRVNVEGSSITPNGDRVKVKIGQPIEFIVTADSEGEIHVHSDPEQELEYNKGTTVLPLKAFDKAGIIEVESHALDKTIVQLEVQ